MDIKINKKNTVKQRITLFACVLLMSFTSTLIGQTIKGKVIDGSGEPLPFVNVLKKNTVSGVSTDENGEFSLNVKELPVTLVFSSVGFTTMEQTVFENYYVNVVLKEGNVLNEIVLTGNRSKPRTILDSAVPIDNVSLKELEATGQSDIAQMLTYAIPSYNSSTQSISDGTAHFDPADLRGLGPSRTLVLVNGKRKNQSALVYVNDTPGKGEVGVDMKSIPTAAIERIEVLRDGASAQYGSDAVAGVINIILKKNIDFTKVNVSAGVTKEGDGFNTAADVNHTFTFGDGGFVNTTLGLSYQEKTNRPNSVTKDLLFGGVIDNQWTQDNPGLGMQIGLPEMKKGDLFVNAELPLNENTTVYAFGGFNVRQGTSFALYRTPYFPGIPTDPSDNPFNDGNGDYEGFQPTFETDIKDFLFTGGTKFKLGGFDADLSATYGKNSVGYTVGNTFNTALGLASPTSFDVGAYAFSNIIGNFDVSRSFGDVSIGLGFEGRQEKFEVTAGQSESYEGLVPGDGGHSQSFPGLQPGNALSETRTNIGGYATLDWDISEKFLIAGAARHENYSDFGGNTSWKISSRYKLGEAGVLRASYGTGFRAPSLHQVYLSNVQTLLTVGVISNQGTFNNVSPVIKDLGVASLFAETSKSFSGGLTVKASNNFTISLDYYNIKITDRVVFSGEITGTDDNGNPNAAVQQILDDNTVTSIKFFINAADTETEGIDYTMRYKNIDFASGKLGINLALNLNSTKLQGEVKTPTKLSGYKNAIFNRKEQARIISARPSTKFLFGADYKINKFTANLNNTYFGEVTWQHATDPANDQTFSGKVITDLSFGYEFSDMISFTAQVNNLFDIYPDVLDPKGDVSTNLGGRFKYPWEVNQFGFSGTTFKAGFAFKF